ncbi:MAG TPA: hypothetical protein DC049_08225 [Spirochaetia bacterium]|nr:hypothetical protein [Spirochaetia bacterium]
MQIQKNNCKNNRRPGIECLAFTFYSFYTEGFVRQLKEYNPEICILVFDFDKIQIYAQPPGFKSRYDIVPYWRPSCFSLSIVKPFVFLADMFITVKLLFYLCRHLRPQKVWVENTFAAVIFSIFKLSGWIGKIIYMSGDWLVNSNNNKNLISFLGSNVFFPVCDYIACVSSALVLNITENISSARRKFWGKKITGREEMFAYSLEIKCASEKISDQKQTTMLFLGNIRPDSGLDIAIAALKQLREKHDFRLKIIGHIPPDYAHYRSLIAENKLEKYIDFAGFIKTGQLTEILQNCFCGLNIITSRHSYSSVTLPGKIFHYLQFMLPVIATGGVGHMQEIIQKHRLGIIIDPCGDSAAAAVLEIFRNQNQYRRNILEYIKTLPEVRYRDILESV